MAAITNKSPRQSTNYEIAQVELVRELNKLIRNKKSGYLFLTKLRNKLIDEQEFISEPTLAFITGCRFTGRLDLIDRTKT